MKKIKFDKFWIVHNRIKAEDWEKKNLRLEPEPITVGGEKFKRNVENLGPKKLFSINIDSRKVICASDSELLFDKKKMRFPFSK